ncbi:MAG: hypothetical protein ACRC1L_09025 [Prochlorococcaceae cyanobacterium]
MQLTVFPASRPLALGMILASALLTGIGTVPGQAEPTPVTGRSRAPVSLPSDPLDPSTGTSRIRSIAPVAQEGSVIPTGGTDTGNNKRSRAPGTAN